ncbi:MAG: hypothetical protein R6V13_00455 [Anaerolineae bacterium]
MTIWHRETFPPAVLDTNDWAPLRAPQPHATMVMRGRWHFRHAEIDAWLESHRRGGTNKGE